MACPNPWSRTNRAFTELNAILSCYVCNQLMKNPSVAAECGHFFCSHCISGSYCPKCGAFLYSKDVKIDRQLEGAIATLEKLQSLHVLSVNANTVQVDEANISHSKKRRRNSFKTSSEIDASNSISERKVSKTLHEIKNTGNTKTLKPRRNNRGETQLHVAAIKGNVEKIRSLLDQGLDPNIKDYAGWGALHEACNYGHVEVATALLEGGSEVNLLGLDNVTPLHDAVYNDHLGIISLLLRFGADKTIQNGQGLKPIDCTSNPEVVKLLTDAHESTHRQSDKENVNRNIMSRIVLLPTGFQKQAENDMLDKCVSHFHVEMVMAFSDNVTHVIVNADKNGCCPRTLKYLNAILSGKWIVDIKWVKQSLKLGSFVNEEDYELKGSKDVPNLMTPKRARENYGLKLPKLFDGCKFYFMNEFRPPAPCKEDLAELVVRGGGTVLSRRPDKESNDNCAIYHSKEKLSSSNFIVYDPNCTKQISHQTGCYYVSFKWLMDCISSFKIIYPHV